MIRFSQLFTLAAFFAVSSPSIASDFHLGYQAYEAGLCKKAYRVWYVDAEMGDKASSEALSLFSINGCPMDQDFDQLKDPESGIGILEFSVEPELLFELAKFLELTQGVFQDTEKSIEIYEKAYDRGFGAAAADLYRLTGLVKWRAGAISTGDTVALCDDGLEMLETASGFEEGISLLVNCQQDQKVEGLLRAAQILLDRGDPERALTIIQTIPEADGTLGPSAKLAIALKQGQVKEARADEFFQLAQLESTVVAIEESCMDADSELVSVSVLYKNSFRALPPELDKNELRESLERVIATRTKNSSWCSSKIDEMTFTIEKAFAALDSGDYEKAWDSCDFFKSKSEHSASCNLIQGVILFHGLGRESDQDWGKKLLERAADAGLKNATLELASISIDAKKIGNTLNITNTLEGLTRSSSATLEQKGRAFMLLGNLEKRLQDDRSSGRNYYDTKKLYQKSIDLRYWPAYVAMGFLYDENKVGMLTVDRFEKAFDFFKVAGKHNVMSAYPKLCEYFATGKGTSVNKSEASRWCTKAVDSGHAQSMTYLN